MRIILSKFSSERERGRDPLQVFKSLYVANSTFQCLYVMAKNEHKQITICNKQYVYIHIYKRAKLTSKKRGIKRDREDKGDKDALNSRIHARTGGDTREERRTKRGEGGGGTAFVSRTSL